MGSATAMAVLVGILAVILVGAFLIVWMRDKNRSQEVAEDPERLDTDPTRPNHSSGQ
jgi:hypothetical protein